MRWTEDQLTEYQARQKMEPPPIDDDEKPDPELESVLQLKCMDYCRAHGFPAFHDFSKKKNQPGWPDLFIFAKNRVVLVELKAACGKLRPEQRHLRQVLSWLGHTVYVVRSYAGFIRVMEGTGN